MLALAVFVCVCAFASALPVQVQVQPNSMNSVNMNMDPNPENKNTNMGSMFEALDVKSMLKTFDPKFVVVNDQQGDLPAGVHRALVRSLITDLHSANVPVVYAEKRDLPSQQSFV